VGYAFVRETIGARVGEAFRIQPPQGEAFEAVLSTCDDAPPGFSLIFHGPREPARPQGIMRLSHAELGDDDLFLVPLGPDERGMRYEAVIS
jgi:hypothetical protein